MKHAAERRANNAKRPGGKEAIRLGSLEIGKAKASELFKSYLILMALISTLPNLFSNFRLLMPPPLGCLAIKH
jgi:hypothetical protein